MIYIIENKILKVSIDSKGAQIISVLCNNRERLWQNSDGSWSDHAPILFPVCGKCKVIIDDKDYNMPFHGLAINSDFIVYDKKNSSIIFQFNSNDETKKIYPYDFSFYVQYKIKHNKLCINYVVKNNCDKKMYFSCGAHDSVVVDSKLEEYNLYFNKKEKLLAFYDDNGFLTENYKDFGCLNNFPILNSGLKDDNSVVFKNIKSNKITLLKNNKKIVKISFNDLHHLVLWRTQNNDMICIEPWGNLPDDKLNDNLEFNKKDGVMHVDPLSQKVIKRSIKYY